MTAENLSPAFAQTKFGQSQTGSICSYQLTHTEANFSATINIASIHRLKKLSTNRTDLPQISFIGNGYIFYF